MPSHTLEGVGVGVRRAPDATADAAIDTMLASAQSGPARSAAQSPRLDSALEFAELQDIINDIRLLARCAELADETNCTIDESAQLELHRWAVRTLARWGARADDKLDALSDLIAAQRICFQPNAKTEA